MIIPFCWIQRAIVTSGTFLTQYARPFGQLQPEMGCSATHHDQSKITYSPTIRLQLGKRRRVSATFPTSSCQNSRLRAPRLVEAIIWAGAFAQAIELRAVKWSRPNHRSSLVTCSFCNAEGSRTQVRKRQTQPNRGGLGIDLVRLKRKVCTHIPPALFKCHA